VTRIVPVAAVVELLEFVTVMVLVMLLPAPTGLGLLVLAIVRCAKGALME
jgi:hypothetical protein